MSFTADNRKNRVLMLLPNGFEPDPRVYREAKTLVDQGFRVTILAWDREARWPKSENIDGIEVRRIAIKSTYGRGTRQLFYLFLFWIRAFQITMRLRFHVLHCHDFLTLPIGFIIAKAKNAKTIFDAHESYGEMLGGNVLALLKKLIYLFENLLIRHIDLLITVGEILEREYQRRGAAKTRVVGNWKSLEEFRVDPERIESERRRLGITPDQLVISFLGFLHRDRKILPLIEAVKKTENVFLILGGMGAQEEEIKDSIQGCQRILFIGRYGSEQIPIYTNLSDVIYYVLDSTNPNAKYSAPNKLFEALAAGKAILCGDHGEIARIVREQGCGLVLQQNDAEDLADILQKLSYNGKVNDFKARAAEAGRKRYNWAKAEQVLIQSYRELLSEAR